MTVYSASASGSATYTKDGITTTATATATATSTLSQFDANQIAQTTADNIAYDQAVNDYNIISQTLTLSNSYQLPAPEIISVISQTTTTTNKLSVIFNQLYYTNETTYYYSLDGTSFVQATVTPIASAQNEYAFQVTQYPAGTTFYQNGTTHTIVLQSVAQDQTSILSNVVEFVQGTPTITSLTAYPSNTGAYVDFMMYTTSTPNLTYIYSITDGTTISYGTFVPNSPYYLITNLTNGTNYTIDLKALNQYGLSNAATTTVIPSSSAPIITNTIITTVGTNATVYFSTTNLTSTQGITLQYYLTNVTLNTVSKGNVLLNYSTNGTYNFSLSNLNVGQNYSITMLLSSSSSSGSILTSLPSTTIFTV